jgi:steroid delta-isomerase-like uncharacterized protein
MPIDSHTIIQRWFAEVWNQGREESIDELLGPHCVAHGLGEGADTQGPAGFKPFLRNMRSAFPDVHIRVEDTIVSDDRAATRVIFEGTHSGNGIGVAPTGRRVSITGLVIVRIAGDQIVEAWNVWDQLGLLRQIGAIADPEAPDRFLSTRA